MSAESSRLNDIGETIGERPMRGRTVLLILLTSLLLVTRSAWSQTDDARWIKLGDKRVGSGLETEAVEVGRHAGTFERIRIAAIETDVLVQELRVYFANGDVQRLTRDARIARNTQSEAFTIDGGPRDIERIELTFKGRATVSRREASVAIWGERANAERQIERPDAVVLDDDWLVLGKKSVSASIDHTVIPVGREAGRFEAIRIAVEQNDVAFHDIRVIYLNGEVDTLAVRRLIRAGDASPPLVLKGEQRFIREIELVQEANPNMQGQAVVQVLARRVVAMR
jgi:hypothetical protein